MTPRFSQVAASTPFNDTDTALNVLNLQDVVEDALWMQRNYLPVRARDYFVPTGYQFKAYNQLTLDHYIQFNGDGVIF